MKEDRQMETEIGRDEVALSRAVLYRFLSLACAYPTADTCASLRDMAESALVGAAVLGPRVESAARDLCARLEQSDDGAMELAHTGVFTLTSSVVCPAYETAYTAKHLFQASEQMADVAGFYRAFGVDTRDERPDSLAMELEFAYLLALKEAYAIEHHGRPQVAICRRAERAFLRDHLGRWGDAVAERMVSQDPEGTVGAAGSLLTTFLAWERRHLRAGAPAPLPDEPYRPDDAAEGEAPCMAGELAGGSNDEA
jgi:TorA maturation chaperone TorD